jgi:hypothetical protein
MRPTRIALRLLLGSFVVVAALGLRFSRAQGPADVGYTELEQEQRKHRDLMPGVLKGNPVCNPNDQKHVDAIDSEAKWITYRFWYPEFHTTTDQLKSVDRLYRDFDSDLSYLKRSKSMNPAAAEVFTKRVIVRGMEVLKTPRRQPIAQINVARVLAGLAELGQGELADALVDLLQDKNQEDGVKYWALRGLQQLMSAPAQNPPVLTPERKEKAIKALVDFINRKAKFLESAPRAEVEGFRVLRREALAALNNCGLPTLADKDKTRPALTLLRVMANEGLLPPARMDERVEAAIGLARMQPDQAKNYNADYAAQQIGIFLEQFSTFAASENSKEKLPCRVYAARLYEALEAMGAANNDPYVKQIVKESLSLLARIELNRQPDPQALSRIAKDMPPPSTQLYKDLKDSGVKPAAE